MFEVPRLERADLHVHVPFCRSPRPYCPYHRSAETTKFRGLLAGRHTAPISSVATSFDGTIVLVIGESTSRRHMELYGYWRDTTPELARRRDQLVVFHDVVSQHCHTVPALMAALTSSGSSEPARYFDAGSIDVVSLARAAGFETYWLSNQNEYGIWNNPISVIGKSADHVRFFSTALGTSFRSQPDGEMLPALRQLLAQDGAKRRLVIVHLFSTHWPYCGSYPKEFARFTGALGKEFFGEAKSQAPVNCYDSDVGYVPGSFLKLLPAPLRLHDRRPCCT